jgi:hypothetical protein
MSGGLVEVSTEAWPLVIVRMPDKLDDPAIDSMLKGLDAVVALRTKFSILIDSRKLRHLPDARARARLGEYMKDRSFAEAAYNCGNAIIISSAWSRGVLTAINWFRPPLTKQSFFGSFHEGLEWCCERLTESNIAHSPQLVALRAKSAREPM